VDFTGFDAQSTVDDQECATAERHMGPREPLLREVTDAVHAWERQGGWWANYAIALLASLALKMLIRFFLRFRP
jgi:anti-sigma-K factor RskA